MQDRFKFRFYDKDKKIIIDENSDYTMLVNIYGRDEWWSCFEAQFPTILDYFDKEKFADGKWCKLNFVIMQCTGLKDKNGKLIYEGDIVKFNYDTDEIKAVVSWDDIELIGFYLNTTDYFKDKYVTDYDFYKNDYEVIGNRYQNPELLED